MEKVWDVNLSMLNKNEYVMDAFSLDLNLLNILFLKQIWIDVSEYQKHIICCKCLYTDVPERPTPSFWHQVHFNGWILFTCVLYWIRHLLGHFFLDYLFLLLGNWVQLW